MKLETFFERPSAWLSRGLDSNIALSSRVRLARNLDQHAFPGRASREERLQVWEELREILCAAESLPDPIAVAMADLTRLQKMLLFERHLISREHAEKEDGAGLVVAEDESCAVMVNEEDHLRMQAMVPGLDLQQAWSTLDRVDRELELQVSYAFSTRLGYLTACPSNVGTGIRASVMLHLPGLVLMEEAGPIIKGLGKIGLAVRGLGGEGSESAGNVFQVSNQITLGDREEKIISNLDQIVREIMEHEKNARVRLLQKKEMQLHDHVGRSYGILRHAGLISSKEALDLLSGLRLGLDMSLVQGVAPRTLDELMMQTRPGHLQRLFEKPLAPAERDEARASLIRTKLAETRFRV